MASSIATSPLYRIDRRRRPPFLQQSLGPACFRHRLSGHGTHPLGGIGTVQRTQIHPSPCALGILGTPHRHRQGPWADVDILSRRRLCKRCNLCCARTARRRPT
ncbi:hypothetical protein VFPBJ_07273 [Purpureocillium lilacinum]|uniref:Uncharacterized protein n=1 Tax=Purpureocillium lilacinum TaxID=33203 RepID=A0A179GMZ9_PURLI|nr:hypothetical protein VFPBJ_07273 [Purpureocillium lilacinum]